MNTTPPNPTPPTNLAQLSAQWLEHLEREECFLTATRDSLTRTRSALLGKDRGATDEALRNQESLAASGRVLRGQRDALKIQLCAALGCAPNAVTLRLLAARLPEENGQSLAAMRERLTHLSAEVERLNRDLAGLVYYSLDFLNHCFAGLTDAAPGARYGRAGRAEGSSFGPVLRARG